MRPCTLVCLGTLLAGCGIGNPDTTASKGTPTAAELLQQHEATWRRNPPSSYQYVYSEYGFVPAETLRVTVRNGAVANTELLESNMPGGGTTTPGRTIEQLFDEIRAADADAVTVDYDETVGYPVKAHFDFGMEGYWFEVSDFSPLCDVVTPP